MAQMEQRVNALERSENTVCNRLESMEQRQTQRHEQLTQVLQDLREELVASNSIKPRR